jgi:hypothetical protein
LSDGHGVADCQFHRRWVFDDTLKQGLAISLQQSPFGLSTDPKVRETLKLMGRPRSV